MAPNSNDVSGLDAVFLPNLSKEEKFWIANQRDFFFGVLCTVMTGSANVVSRLLEHGAQPDYRS